MKAILSLILLLSSQAFASSDVCVASIVCNPAGFRCIYNIENCAEANILTSKKSELVKRMSDLGYEEKASLFNGDSIVVFQLRGASNTNEHVCIAKTEGLRTDAEGARIEFSCSNRPYARTILPKNLDLLKKDMKLNGFSRGSTKLSGGKILFY